MFNDGEKNAVGVFAFTVEELPNFFFKKLFSNATEQRRGICSKVMMAL
ncbi:hypothetical protein CWATWH0402_2831 [Crocosphaera watsonii WH 0402]|uniref:Uncharacterized protein n=1 Tax=Crocosphaera watsonii WH 0402 TaxID=1284629 RepID=T2JUX1_CROWT|nr:hypothetical protein CWATWH0402_2831 [Crocosphaera watsonii WH 0402]